jgi:glyoxylase I family protein
MWTGRHSYNRWAMEVAGIHHVAVNVDRLDEALRFYEQGLGFHQIARPDFGFPGAWLQAGQHQIHLMERPGLPHNASQHFALRVADLDVAVAMLEAHGIDVRRERYVSGAGRQAFLRDPSGNRIELNEPDG